VIIPTSQSTKLHFPCSSDGRGRSCPAPSRSRARSAGMSLLEVLVTLALLLILVGYVAPSFAEWRSQQQLRGALTALQLSVMKIRTASLSSGRAHGLAFSLREGDLFWDTVVDGDGDGIRRSDLAIGTDLPLEPERRLAAWFPGVRPGRPAGVPPLAGGSAGNGGLALGRSRILASAPDGSTSSGTIYLCTGNDYGAALRLYGPTGRGSVWWWNFRHQTWEPLR
jgi:prepilin-type N-terminal cleavage/methylation domain-containing protein